MGKLVFNINPCSAPRMTRSDKWKSDPNHKDPRKRQRLCVTKYFAFKSEFSWACKKYNYSLQSVLYVEFYIPMPETWSRKKKLEMEHKPHMQKPDIDNLVKGVMDSFGKDDGFVYQINASKFWAKEGAIYIIL